MLPQLDDSERLGVLTAVADTDSDLTQRLEDSGHDKLAAVAAATNRLISRIQQLLTDISTSTDELYTAASTLTEAPPACRPAPNPADGPRRPGVRRQRSEGRQGGVNVTRALREGPLSAGRPHG